jgi:hypothetical protein
MLISGAVRDRWVPLVALLSPVITYLIDRYSTVLFAGYSFGFELLLLNGALTFAGLLLLRVSGAAAAPSRS